MSTFGPFARRAGGGGVGFYDEEAASRGAGEMNVLINTVGVVRSDAPIDVDEEACFSIHASANNGQTPASIVFTVLSTPEGLLHDSLAKATADGRVPSEDGGV